MGNIDEAKNAKVETADEGQDETETVRAKNAKVETVEPADVTPGTVSAKSLSDYYEQNAVSYQQVADKFNVRLYDVRKLLDADFKPHPDVESGEIAAD